MGRLGLKNVCEKDGRLYYRRKIKGEDFYTRLPDADDPTFAEEYAKARREVSRVAPARGTMAALVAEYRASSDFRLIPSDVTRRNYNRYLDMIVADHGHRFVRDLRPVHVKRIRDSMMETPGKANNWLSVMKTLLSYAAQNDWRGDNPAKGIPALEGGEHEPWPAEVLEQALAVAGPMDRLIIITGLCSGARVGDAIRMAHNWHDGRMMQFTASKNKGDVALPMHPLWLAEIAKVPKKAVTILYDRGGKPFGTTGAVQARLRRLMREIVHPGYTFHGLSKNACCYLAELNLTDDEISVIVGKTPQTVRHYTKRKRAYMIALNVADRVTSGAVLPMLRGDETRKKGDAG